MTLADLLSEKYRLSSAIGKLVDEFYDSTGVMVETIEIVGENTVMDPTTRYLVSNTAVKVRLAL